MKRSKAVLALQVLAMAAPFASAQPMWTDLGDDMSRSELGAYEMLKYAPPGEKAARRNFIFPQDASDGVYGVDVSHHNGVVDWRRLAAVKVRFAYIKATQGATFKDGKFEENWSAASSAGIARGAYHFLSAGVDATEQAKSYLALLARAGGLSESDLTPVLDLEWDMETIGTEKVDRWRKFSADEIVKAVKDWMTEVEKGTGRRPIIYTAASWWKERIGASMLLKDFYHWIADYRLSSISAQAPASVRQHPYRLWQFTDVGGLDGGAGMRFDVNRLKGRDLVALSGKQVAPLGQVNGN